MKCLKPLSYHQLLIDIHCSNFCIGLMYTAYVPPIVERTPDTQHYVVCLSPKQFGITLS